MTALRSRMLKAICGECAYTVRITRKWLEEAGPHCGRQQVDVLAAMAFLVELHTSRRPELAALVEARYGRAPRELALQWIDEAHALQPSRTLQESRIFLRARLIGSALRVGDRSEALVVLGRVLDELQLVSDRSLAEKWHRALTALRSELLIDRKEPWDELRRDYPLLDGVVPKTAPGEHR